MARSSFDWPSGTSGPKSGIFSVRGICCARELVADCVQKRRRVYFSPRVSSKKTPDVFFLAGDLQYLPRFDLVGIRELILVRLEDLHVGSGAAQLVLGNLAERVASLDRVGSRRGGRRRRAARDLDIRHDVVLPSRNGLDGSPDFVLFSLGGHRALEVQLAIALLGTAAELALALLDGVRVRVS